MSTALTAEVSRPSHLLRRAGWALTSRGASVDEVLAGLSVSGFGLVLAALAVPNLLPSPGVPLGLMLGVPLLVLAGQYALGFDRPALPSWLSRHRRVAPLLGRGLRWLAPRVRWWERKVAGRPLSTPAFPRRVVFGGWVMLMALLIILPIPFGNTLPALSTVFVGAGLFMNDRTTIAAGLGTGAAALLFSVAVVFGTWELIQLLLA